MSEFMRKIGIFWDKVKYYFSHNVIFRITSTYWIFFSFIKIRVTNKRRQSVIGLSFILIWIIGYLIFALYPIFYSLFLSFFKVRLDGSDLQLTYLGIDNYKAAFVFDPTFIQYLIDYIIEIIINVPITIVFALIIALLINQDIKGKGMWRTIFFLPVIIISGPVIAELINQGATTLPSIREYDFVRTVLNNISPTLANPIQALMDRILLVLWFAGIQILIFLAGLQKIDKEIYEASMVDGAGPWASFWKITLPSLKPLIVVAIIYTVVSMSVFSLNEVIIYIRGVMMGESIDSIISGYGYSAAISWLYFIVMVLIILLFTGLMTVRKRSKS
ncbi:MAG: sugar ABC transporter permease [Bacilli bacterium]|nr:sugar ABC transporter permease [Bacilli bacterium]